MDSFDDYVATVTMDDSFHFVNLYDTTNGKKMCIRQFDKSVQVLDLKMIKDESTLFVVVLLMNNSDYELYFISTQNTIIWKYVFFNYLIFTKKEF